MENNMKVIVASINPVKISSAEQGFTTVFPNDTWTCVGVSAASEVSDQPMTNEETLQGALNRLTHARLAEPDADYYIAHEGGCAIEGEKLSVYAWIVVEDREGKIGKAKTGQFYLPEKVAELVRGGMELGHAADVVFKASNTKQNSGSVGILTNDVIDRTAYYKHAVVLALIPFLQTELY